MVKQNKMKLNLGSGKDYVLGWVNVDVDTQNKVDVIANLNNRFPFKESSVDEIKAADILEHFTKEDGEKFLKECHRVLKPDGVISIRTHNIYQIFEQFRDDPKVLAYFLYGGTSQTGVFGSHKYGYSRDSLIHVLKKVGFEIVSFNNEETNFLVIAKKIKQKSKKLNVGIIMQSPDIGGAEVYMLSLMECFKRKGDEVYLASNREKFLDKASEISSKTYEIPVIMDIIGDYKGLLKTIILLPFSFIFYLNLLRTFKKDKVDVILMSNFSEKLFVSLLSRLFAIPVVWIEYGRLGPIFKKNFYLPKIIYRLAKNVPKKIIVPSRNTMESLITDARVSLSKLELVPLGVKPGVSKKNSVNRKWGDKFIIGSVSRLTREKGQEYLIRAMPLVLTQIPNARLLIAGDGPDRKYYEDIISSLNLNTKVTLSGFVEDLNSYYDSMDLFVFPTVWDLEGFGLVLVEAMFHKLPVIATKIGPVDEIVDDGRSGILVNSKNVIDLADRIIELAKDSARRDSFAKAGYEKAKNKYSLEKSANHVLDILYDATIT